MGDAIIDYIEEFLVKGEVLFKKRYHAIHCDVVAYDRLCI